MGGELGVRGVEDRLVAVGTGDAGLEVVRHDQAGAAAEEGERVDVRRDPVGQLLGRQRLGIGVVRRPEDRHEELGLRHLAGGGIDDRDGLAGEVDEQLLARAVLLAHHEIEPPPPVPVVAAELGVLVAVGLALLVFEVQQLEGHALSSQLAMDRRPVGQRPARRRRRLRLREQAGLELCVVHAVGQRPAEAGLERADQVVGHGGVGQARGRPGRAAAQSLAEGEAENLADLAHGGTGAWHRHRSSNG
jgi:hypothetical protein